MTTVETGKRHVLDEGSKKLNFVGQRKKSPFL